MSTGARHTEGVSAEVLVVGAGPAGSATALRLARLGHDVLLLDRERFPRAKPCGECLSPQATRLLDDLGVLDAVLALAPARLHGWRIVAPGGGAFEAAFRDVAPDPQLATALAISRARLDAALLDAAVRAGARFQADVRVRDLTAGSPGVMATTRTGGTLEGRARLVIGADGLRSVVARRLGLAARRSRLRKLSLTGHLLDIEPDPDGFGEMHLADGMCAGIAPIDAAGRSHNLSLVADAGRFGRDASADPVGFFRQSLLRFARLRERTGAFRFEDAATAGRTGPLQASGPFDRPARGIVRPGYALVGDAAGYYDPFTGQGVYQALAGACLLAEAAADALRCDFGPPLLVQYEKEQRRLVRGARRLQRIIEGVTGRPALADRAIARLARRPEAARALLAATGDLVPALDALRPAVLLRFLAPRAKETVRT